MDCNSLSIKTDIPYSKSPSCFLLCDYSFKIVDFFLLLCIIWIRKSTHSKVETPKGLFGHTTTPLLCADGRGIFLFLISLIEKVKKRNHQTTKGNYQPDNSNNIGSHHNHAPPFLCNPVPRYKIRRLPLRHGYSRASTHINYNIFIPTIQHSSIFL